LEKWKILKEIVLWKKKKKLNIRNIVENY
jgi:hypothetical protein